jgi:hypothetical protein
MVLRNIKSRSCFTSSSVDSEVKLEAIYLRNEDKALDINGPCFIVHLLWPQAFLNKKRQQPEALLFTVFITCHSLPVIGRRYDY